MNKKNLPLIIALCIPVVMIILVAAFIYLPSWGKKPQYNFVYMTGSNSYYYDSASGRREYVVSGGHLVYNEVPSPAPGIPPVYKPDANLPHFYLYDSARDESTEISFAQPQSYKLDASSVSPDGYTVERGNYGGGDFLFAGGGRDYNSWFIKGHNRSHKLNLKITGNNYYDIQFLGWIE